MIITNSNDAVRGAYAATQTGWVIWRPLVGDVVFLIDHWCRGSTANVIAAKRNAALHNAIAR